MDVDPKSGGDLYLYPGKDKRMKLSYDVQGVFSPEPFFDSYLDFGYLEYYY